MPKYIYVYVSIFIRDNLLLIRFTKSTIDLHVVTNVWSGLPLIV